MALIHEIQKELLSDKADLASILLKLRFLAAKLGSHPLAAWVKHEAEGYPNNVDLPEYRELGMAYRGTFSGPFGSGIQNAPIPSVLIESIAGKQWSGYSLRQSVAAIDQLVSADKDGNGGVHLDLSNLILVVQGKIYPNYVCNEIKGFISTAELREVQHVVRNRILELALEIEKSVPGIENIGIGSDAMNTPSDSGKVSQIFYQTIHGSMTNVSNTGSVGEINIGIQQADLASLRAYLVNQGISADDANSFSKILASEKPESQKEPFGEKAKTWIAKNLNKAVDGTWNVGIGVATDVLKSAALGYYGLTPPS